MGEQVWDVAVLVSKRRQFLVDGRFAVVLDKTDFGHVIGEVELEREVFITGEGGGAEEQVEDQQRAQMIAKMDQEIDDFTKRYVWAYPPGNPNVGKLSACSALKRRQ